MKLTRLNVLTVIGLGLLIFTLARAEAEDETYYYGDLEGIEIPLDSTGYDESSVFLGTPQPSGKQLVCTSICLDDECSSTYVSCSVQ